MQSEGDSWKNRVESIWNRDAKVRINCYGGDIERI